MSRYNRSESHPLALRPGPEGSSDNAKRDGAGARVWVGCPYARPRAIRGRNVFLSNSLQFHGPFIVPCFLLHSPAGTVVPGCAMDGQGRTTQPTAPAGGGERSLPADQLRGFPGPDPGAGTESLGASHGNPGAAAGDGPAGGPEGCPGRSRRCHRRHGQRGLPTAAPVRWAWVCILEPQRWRHHLIRTAMSFLARPADHHDVTRKKKQRHEQAGPSSR